ncbi:MAG: hypothetical protein AB1473_24245 [Thermodesulfobacteriota bacterium]
MLIKYVMCLLALLVGISAFAETPSPIVREEAKLTVNGVEEIWRLEWASAPSPVCSADEPDIWSTCPCAGFAFGERGNLVLVRQRPGQEQERLSLSQLFTGQLDGPADAGEAVLRRWDVEEKDLKEGQSPGFASKVRARQAARVMRFEDYDHDGKATEFAFQVGTLPCGKKMNVVIGISDRNSRLHVFSSVERPDKPLILQASHWEALLKAKAPVKVVDWACGDHGSDTETELELSADEKGIHATKTEYQCKKNGTRGRLVSKEGL